MGLAIKLKNLPLTFPSSLSSPVRGCLTSELPVSDVAEMTFYDPGRLAEFQCREGFVLVGNSTLQAECVHHDTWVINADCEGIHINCYSGVRYTLLSSTGPRNGHRHCDKFSVNLTV